MCVGRQLPRMHIRSILICGATGHLGTYLVNGLLESRHDFDVSILLRETSFQVDRAICRMCPPEKLKIFMLC